MNKDVLFSAYITNLGKYNEGELVGEWVDFPTTNETIQKVFASIGIDFKRYEEYFITDYESNIEGLTDCFGEYESITELNCLASMIQDMGEDQDFFEAALETGEYSSSVADLINLTENMDCFEYLRGIYSDYDLGYYWIEESGCYEIGNCGILSNYIDYKNFGRDVRLDNGGMYVNGGYICLTGDSFTEYYNGSVEEIPEEYWLYPETEGGEEE